ncbi:methyltransferase, partial [Streptomyces rubiginosohelvolus]
MRGVRLPEGEDDPVTPDALPDASVTAPAADGAAQRPGRVVRLPGVYRPQTDTLLLALAMRREGIGPGTDLLDLCTGSGALALHAARLG